ncbi:MAG: gamma-glutamyltransferase [Chromatiales bacterium]|jgi:gamma-glutamyltranspeptidase/glutathione hydrolase|nr:MAG: gamma-glutamyltransferase [Chromatiales bacterium]
MSNRLFPLGRHWAIAALALLLFSTAFGAEPRPARAAIATAHPLATAAGMEVLEQGGNAFDAAVAVSAALAVVEPNGSGLGGGAFWLMHRAADGLDVMVDGREAAPGAATRDMYLDAAGNPIPRASMDGPLAAGIPGQPAGLAHITEKYGNLSLAENLAPAIRIARDGFPLYARLRAGLRFKLELLKRWPAGPEVFLPGGELPELGFVIRQPDLARTLEAMAANGAAGFYDGDVAARLVAAARAEGGIWTREDLRSYRVVEREPVVGEYRGMRVISASPPSSGGVALINALGMLAGYQLETLDPVTAQHLIVEAMRRAFRDRAEYLGDPDFVDVPVEQLTHPFYAAGQRASIRFDRATPSADLPGILPAGTKGTETTHFSVMDAEGNRVAASLSLNFWFGSGFMAPGTGVFLNNEMDDFSIKAGVPNGYQLVGADANKIVPGKRMLSSMTPTFLESDRGIAILGTPGGSRIISMVLLASLAWHQGASAEEMVSLPRYHHQYLPDVVSFEPDAIAAERQAALAELGHEVKALTRRYGNLQVVTWDFASGEVEAASDPRGEGEGRVY